MNVLLVDDEPGIREGLASFLRIKGHRVVTAATCADGIAKLASESFDLLVTDWRIGGDQGKALVVASACPSIVVSGNPEDVRDVGEKVLVLRKPVEPRELLLAVERTAKSEMHETKSREHREQAAGSSELPSDTADRFALALLLAGADPSEARIADDGAHVTLTAPLRLGDAAISDIEGIGGDLQVRADEGGGLRFSLRVWRDGRPDGTNSIVKLGESWPRAGKVAVDCHGADPRRMPEFLAAVKRARRAGIERIAFVNVPSAWRLWLEISGRTDDMPKRAKAGPNLPEFLNLLWSRA